MAAPRLKLTSLRAAIPFKLVVTFSDGTWGTFNAAPMLAERGEGTEPLRDRAYFAQVELVTASRSGQTTLTSRRFGCRRRWTKEASWKDPGPSGKQDFRETRHVVLQEAL